MGTLHPSNHSVKVTPKSDAPGRAHQGSQDASAGEPEAQTDPRLRAGGSYLGHLMLVLDTVGDYAKDDFAITAHCGDCRHAERLKLETLPPELKLTDLRARLRCGVCDSRSTATCHPAVMGETADLKPISERSKNNKSDPLFSRGTVGWPDLDAGVWWRCCWRLPDP